VKNFLNVYTILMCSKFY